MSVILRTNHITKRYGSRPVVSDLSMTIHKGDIYGFIGKNGAGKTTLIRMITGLAAPSDGNILLFGKPDLLDGRRKIGTVIGMRQRLAIAIALTGSPELLILDEPTNGLDPEGIKEIRELILKLNKEREITVLISSHILGELSKFATRYGIIHQGKLIEEFTEDELWERCHGSDPHKAMDLEDYFLKRIGGM